MVDLGALMHAESAYKEYPIDIDYLRNYARHLENDPSGFAAFVNEIDGEFTAVVAGYLAPLYFNPNIKFAYDFLLYSRPDRRGGTAAARLMRAFEDWSKGAGAVKVVMGVTAGIDDPAACKFYEHIGYEKSGAIFSKDMD